MELFKDLNWLIVVALFAIAALPLICVPKPIKDKRWLLVSAFFMLAGLAALFYFVFLSKILPI